MEHGTYWKDSSVDKMLALQVGQSLGPDHALECFTTCLNPSVCGGEKESLALLDRLARLVNCEYIHVQSGKSSGKILTSKIGLHAHYTYAPYTCEHMYTCICTTHKQKRGGINSEPEEGHSGSEV